MCLACATLSLDKRDLTRPAVRLRLEASLGVLEPAKLLHGAPRSVRPELALRRCAAIAAARQIRRDPVSDFQIVAVVVSGVEERGGITFASNGWR